MLSGSGLGNGPSPVAVSSTVMGGGAPELETRMLDILRQEFLSVAWFCGGLGLLRPHSRMANGR